MTNQKQSDFTAVTELDDSVYIGAFTTSENERIKFSDLKSQLRTDIVGTFIYQTVDDLEAADLEADADNPIYVRCEDTEYRLYKITSLAASSDDIPLNNGNTATFQEEYSKSGFVTGAGTVTNGAMVLFSGTSGASIEEGAVPTDVGNNIIEATSAGADSYLKVLADDTAALRTIGQVKTDLSLPGDTVSELALKAPIASPLFTGNPRVPTASAGDNDTTAASTAFVQTAVSDKVKTITAFADLATTSGEIGQQVIIAGHTVNGVGGGRFTCTSGTVTNDAGSKINSATAGRHWLRSDPNKTPYEFGYLDGDDDVSAAANACTAAYGECYLDGGKTYNLQYQIAAKVFDSRGGVAVLNMTSPTANGRFGGTPSGYVNASAVLSLGGVGNKLRGVNIQNIAINCNGLINGAGSTGTKGFLFARCENFYQQNCYVSNCASYAFWDTDTATTGTDYCSGTRDNCYAVDCAVSFEQVNVRGVTLNNCVGYISSASLSYVPECVFHAYGGSDMQITYNNCVGTADGVCPAIFLGLLEVKNMTFNNCQFLNNYDNGVSVQASVFFDAAGTSNFDNITFNNCKLKSQFSTSVTLADGSASTTDNTFRFNSCEIEGYQAGVQLNVTKGRYYFTDCDVRGRATLAVTPFAYYNNGTPTEVKVIGGFAKASTTGSGVPTITNMSSSIFTSTTLDPSGSQPPRVRQKAVGTAVFGGDGSTYANINVTLPSAVLGWTSSSVNTAKISANIQVDYGISGAADLPAAVAMAYPTVITMHANDVVRFVGDNTLEGLTARYEITEWE